MKPNWTSFSISKNLSNNTLIHSFSLWYTFILYLKTFFFIIFWVSYRCWVKIRKNFHFSGTYVQPLAKTVSRYPKNENLLKYIYIYYYYNLLWTKQNTWCVHAPIWRSPTSNSLKMCTYVCTYIMKSEFIHTTYNEQINSFCIIIIKYCTGTCSRGYVCAHAQPRVVHTPVFFYHEYACATLHNSLYTTSGIDSLDPFSLEGAMLVFALFFDFFVFDCFLWWFRFRLWKV